MKNNTELRPIVTTYKAYTMVIVRGNKHKNSPNTRTAFILLSIGCLSGVILTLMTASLTCHNISSSEDNGHKNLRSIEMPQEGPIVNPGTGAIKSDEMLENDDNGRKDPIAVDDVIKFFNKFLSSLHIIFQDHHKTEYDGVWKIYHDYALKSLYPWDREYMQRMPERRKDGSVFLSIVTYRDENCMNTLKWAYEKAKHPDLINIGLVQQNCVENCRSGVIDAHLHTEAAPPDDDCHKIFCESDIGREHCAAGRVRALHINEEESLGPYAARYFGSKLWNGEEWYMQLDAHMTFLQDWDAISIEMLNKAPSEKPVMSHYPPHHTEDLESLKKEGKVNRLCGAYFADSGLEDQIIRLGGPGGDAEGPYSEYPRFAPYTAAGYFVAPSTFLKEVPFDPFLPWIFVSI